MRGVLITFTQLVAVCVALNLLGITGPIVGAVAGLMIGILNQSQTGSMLDGSRR